VCLSKVFLDIIEKRCIVFDIRVHCNSALFVCTCIEFNSVQLRVFAFSLCDNWISFDWHVCIDWCCRDDLVKFCTCIYCSVNVELIELLLRRVFVSPCVCSVCKCVSYRVDVWRHNSCSRATLTVGRPAACVCHAHPFIHSVSQCWSINSSQASLLPRLVPVAWPRWACRPALAPFIHRPYIKSISCSVVLHAFASLLYFRVSFVFEFKQWIKSVFTADTAKLPWKKVEAAADSCDSWPIGPLYFS